MLISDMRINVVGLGYIGLPTALMLATHGVDVIGTDAKTEVVDALNKGKLTFQEEGVDELLQNALRCGIQFSTEYQQADVYIVCVPTPYDETTKRIDPKHVVSATRSVLDVCEPDSTIVIESTVPPGTIDRFVRPLFTERNLVLGTNIHLAHAPERIIPGNMMYELENNSRIVGADSLEIGNSIKALYQRFCKGDIEVTDIRTAEMCKVIENTFRDVNIAFANELQTICRNANLDVHEVIRIANKHPRVNILQPGPGVGGHCISVDPWFLVGDYPEHTQLIRQARVVNDSVPTHVLRRTSEIMRELDVPLDKVGFYGLTYKEDVDDTRNSPTRQLFREMRRHLAPPPKCYDPMLKTRLFDNQYEDFETFANDVSMVVVMVNHTHLASKLSSLKGKLILDTRACNLAWPESSKVFTL